MRALGGGNRIDTEPTCLGIDHYFKSSSQYPQLHVVRHDGFSSKKYYYAYGRNDILLAPRGNLLSCFTPLPPNTSLASLEMALELWKEPAVIAASVLLLIIARVAYKRNRTTGRPPLVSYTIPWVGSSLELGKNPDAFFKRAMYVELPFVRLEARDDPS